MTCTVNPAERLNVMQVCVWLNIGRTAFEAQIQEGFWDGTFVVSGGNREFIARLVEDRQLQLAQRVGENAPALRKSK